MMNKYFIVIFLTLFFFTGCKEEVIVKQEK